MVLPVRGIVLVSATQHNIITVKRERERGRERKIRSLVTQLGGSARFKNCWGSERRVR